MVNKAAPEKEKSEQTAPLSFKDKIIEFKKRAATLPKNGWNANQNYKYHKAEDVFALVNKCETELRLFSVPNFEIAKEYIYDNKDKKNFISVVRVVIVLGDVDGDQSVSFSAYGKGWDNTDKDMGKASTDARKEAWFSFLSISDGPAYDLEDGDDDGGGSGNDRPEAPKTSWQPQVKQLDVTIKKQEPPKVINQDDFEPTSTSCPNHPGKLVVQQTELGTFWNCTARDMKPFAAIKKKAS